MNKIKRDENTEKGLLLNNLIKLVKFNRKW